MLNANRLRILRELSRRGTLAEVARALNYTPSAVSQQLSALEREVGMTLLEPSGRRVRLTGPAMLLAERADLILEQMELAETDLQNLTGTTSGLVRVGSFQSALIELAPAALTLLSQRHPHLVVELCHREVDEARDGLLAHDFDIVLGEEFPGGEQPPTAGVHRQDFHSEPLHLALPDSERIGDRAGSTTLSDLRHCGWALDLQQSRMGAWARQKCREAGFEPRVVCESPDPLLMLQLVRSGHAAAFIPALITQARFGGVEVVALTPEPHRTLYTEVRAGRQEGATIAAVQQAFADAVAAHANAVPTAVLAPATAISPDARPPATSAGGRDA